MSDPLSGFSLQRTNFQTASTWLPTPYPLTLLVSRTCRDRHPNPTHLNLKVLVTARKPFQQLLRASETSSPGLCPSKGFSRNTELMIVPNHLPSRPSLLRLPLNSFRRNESGPQGFSPVPAACLAALLLRELCGKHTPHRVSDLLAIRRGAVCS
jgi:hypothetical protein